MSDQDWKISWRVKDPDTTDLVVNTDLSFNGTGNSWLISTTPSCSWNGVLCTYQDESDTVTGYKGGSFFTISRGTAPSGKAVISCNIPVGARASRA